MAQIYIKELDNSQIAEGSEQLIGGIVVVSSKGRANTPILVDSNNIISLFGKPNIDISPTLYSALMSVEMGGMIYVVRAIHNAIGKESKTNRTARFSGALLKAKIQQIPDSPDLSYTPDKILTPYKANDNQGLKQSDIDSFVFPLYARNREYKKLKNKVTLETSNKEYIVVNSFENLESGAKISFGNNPNDDSAVFEVLNNIEVAVKTPLLTINKTTINANKGDILRRVLINPKNTLKTISETAPKDAINIKVSSTDGFISGQSISFGDSANEYVIQSISKDDSTITLRSGLKGQVLSDSAIMLNERNYEAITNNPIIERNTQGSDTLYVSDIDNILNNATYTLMSGLTNAEIEFVATKKNILNEIQNQVVLDKAISVDTNTIIQLMTAGDTEQRDVALFYADSQGEWGNSVTIQVSDSKDYPKDCKNIKVFSNGVEVETYEVAFKQFVDGLGKQKYIESVINDNSNYIRVKHNPLAVDSEGNPLLPLNNDYALWQELAEDIFSDSGVKILEDANFGDTDIVVSDNTKFEVGDRIKFGNDVAEYKVSGKATNQVLDKGIQVSEFHITIDRGIQVDFIANNSKVMKYDYTEAKKITKIDSIYPANAINDMLKIGNIIGKLIDCGANLFIGGDDGSKPDTADMIEALRVFENRNAIRVNYIMDGGVFTPSYQQKIVSICEKRENTMAFLSSDPISITNEASVTIDKLSKFRDSQNVNSSYVRLAQHWALVYDEYNKREVWISTDGMLAQLQSASAQSEGHYAQVIAGWNRGKISNVLKLNRVWSEDELDLLVDMQFTPIKSKKGKGLCLWGNKTALTTRSFLQMANVRFMLIQINEMLRERLENEHWQIMDSSTRITIAQDLQSSIWNRFNQVLNDCQVFDKTTTQDEDAGKLVLFIGLQPKGVTSDIYVTLGIYNNSKSITEE